MGDEPSTSNAALEKSSEEAVAFGLRRDKQGHFLWFEDLANETVRGQNEAGWALLPDVPLVAIFAYLGRMKQKLRAGLACRNWMRVVLDYDAVWEHFEYRDFMLTRRKFTIHGGWQHTLDHWRMRYFVVNAVPRWRHMFIPPVDILSNLCDLLRVITNFIEFYDDNVDRPLAHIRTFDFEWRLAIQFSRERGKGAPVDFGTGGRVLQTFAIFIAHLHGLKTLAIRHLLLDDDEADGFMTDIVEQFGDQLTSLCVMNLTKTPHCMLHFGLFLSLRKLCLSPQHLNEDNLYLIASNENLLDFFLIQDERTKDARGVSYKAWREAKRTNPNLRVHLRVRGRTQSDVVWQLEAPVVSIVYDTPFAQLTALNAMVMCENYSGTLETFVQRGWARRFRSRAFHERPDAHLLMLITACPKLTLMGIRERISLATALLCATLGSLGGRAFRLYVRRNAVLLRCDWPRAPDWTADFYARLRRLSRDADAAEAHVAGLLGNERWRLLSDKDYRHTFRYRHKAD